MKIELNQTHDTPLAADQDAFVHVIENSKIPVIVDIWAPWCRPCTSMAPVMDELAKKFAGKALFLKVNSDDSPGVAQALGVTGIPAFFWLKGNEIQGRVVGADADGLAKMVKKATGGKSSDA